MINSLLLVFLTLSRVVNGTSAPLLFTCNGPAHTLSVDTLGGYQVTFPSFPSLNLYNGSVSVHQSGAWYSTLTGSLHLDSTSTLDGTDALLGTFSSATLSYTAMGAQPALSVTALFRCYAVGPLVFELAFPGGALNVSTEVAGQPGAGTPAAITATPRKVGDPEFSASLLPSSYFPAFAAAPLRTPATGYIEWNGRFTNDASQYGTGLSGFVGGATGGPLVMFDPLGANSTAFVLGTFDNFKSTMLSIANRTVGSARAPSPPTHQLLVGGVTGKVINIPAGFNHPPPCPLFS